MLYPQGRLLSYGVYAYKKEEVCCNYLIVNTLLKSVPRAGVEPARVAPLVFETSASTDSAIWASAKRHGDELRVQR